MSFYLTNLFNQSILGQNGIYNVIQTTVPFLSINPNPELKGIGDIGVVSMDSSFSSGLISNPALLRNNNHINGIICSIQDKNPNTISLIFSDLQKITFGYSYNYNSYSIASLVPSTNIIEMTNDEEYYHSVRAGYSLNDKLNVGLGFKYFQSNVSTYSAKNIAFDLGMNYKNNLIQNNNFSLNYGVGLSLLNLGPKISYIKDATKEFIPTELSIGGIISGYKKFDIIKLNFGLMYQADKLLVPTPPFYDSNGNIIKGRNPNRSVFNALFTSLYDAPNGYKEELQEIIHHIGTELDIYVKKDFKFAIQFGRTLENKYKGDRNYQTIGLGVEMYSFNFNYSRSFSNEKSYFNNKEMYSLGYIIKI